MFSIKERKIDQEKDSNNFIDINEVVKEEGEEEIVVEDDVEEE